MGERHSPREVIVRDVIRGLYEGRYRPGMRLVEAKLTDYYGVSRGPIREALNRLAAGGIVALSPHRGAQIRLLTVSQATDILVVVQSLVGVAGRLAAMRIDRPGAAQRMAAALEQIVRFQKSGNEAAYARARDKFYATLTDVSGNMELTRILPSVHIHLIRVQFDEAMNMTRAHRETDYRHITEAVLSGRAAAAEAAARRHIGRAMAALLERRTHAVP